MTARGLLFAALTLGLSAIALEAVAAREWVVAVAGMVLAAWMADLARRDLFPRRRP